MLCDPYLDYVRVEPKAVKFLIRDFSRNKMDFLFCYEDKMSSLGMTSFCLANLLFIGNFSPVGFEDLIR
jgi:hypothetical protein